MDWTIVGDPHVTHKSLDRALILFQEVETIGLPTIWTGDLLDTKEVIRGKCLNAFFEYFSKSKLKHIVLVGNHDWFNLECQDHSLRTLSSLPNVTIVDTPTVIEGITFIPYMHDLEKLKNIVSQVSTHTLVAHMDVMDFDYGNGQICDKGLKLEDLKNTPLVISGHFHKYQVKSNLVYIGSPFTHSFGESDDTKFLGKLSSNTNLTLVKTSLPFHTTLKLNLNEEGCIEKLQNFVTQNKTNFRRVELIGTQLQISSFPRDSFNDVNIKWVPRPIETEMNNVSIDEGLDNKQQFIEWAKNIRKLDESTIKLGLSVLESVNVK